MGKKICVHPLLFCFGILLVLGSGCEMPEKSSGIIGLLEGLTPSKQGTTLSGQIMFGPVIGGKIKVFAITSLLDPTSEKILASTTSFVDGSFSVLVPNPPEGPIGVWLEHGQYDEEATANDTVNLDSAHPGFRAIVVLPSLKGKSQATVAITPFSILSYPRFISLAAEVQKTTNAPLETLGTLAQGVNTSLSNAFQMDVITTLPQVLTYRKPILHESDDGRYMLLIAALSAAAKARGISKKPPITIHSIDFDFGDLSNSSNLKSVTDEIQGVVRAIFKGTTLVNHLSFPKGSSYYQTFCDPTTIPSPKPSPSSSPSP